VTVAKELAGEADLSGGAELAIVGDLLGDKEPKDCVRGRTFMDGVVG